MLDDINSFFGDVTPQGAVVLMLFAFLAGVGSHDVIVVIWGYGRDFVENWYDRQHDDDLDSSE